MGRVTSWPSSKPKRSCICAAQAIPCYIRNTSMGPQLLKKKRVCLGPVRNLCPVWLHVEKRQFLPRRDFRFKLEGETQARMLAPRGEIEWQD